MKSTPWIPPSSSVPGRPRPRVYLLISCLLLLFILEVYTFLTTQVLRESSVTISHNKFRLQSRISALPPKQIVVIGAGIGGLVTAGRLARATRGRNVSITIVEKNDRESAGGRLGEYTWEGHRWETGPSLLLLPDVYMEIFEHLGGSFPSASNSTTERTSKDDMTRTSAVKCGGGRWERQAEPPIASGGSVSDGIGPSRLTKVEPSYLVIFGDNDRLELYSNRSRMVEAINRLEPGGFPRYQDYLESAQNNLDFGLSAFIKESPQWEYFPAFCRNLNLNARFWPLASHHRQLEGLFDSKKLQAALSFQDLYVGLTPYEAPAVFSLLQAIELNQGVFYPLGGFAQV